jgi:hypothetical protein
MACTCTISCLLKSAPQGPFWGLNGVGAGGCCCCCCCCCCRQCGWRSSTEMGKRATCLPACLPACQALRALASGAPQYCLILHTVLALVSSPLLAPQWGPCSKLVQIKFSSSCQLPTLALHPYPLVHTPTLFTLPPGFTSKCSPVACCHCGQFVKVAQVAHGKG